MENVRSPLRTHGLDRRLALTTTRSGSGRRPQRADDQVWLCGLWTDKNRSARLSVRRWVCPSAVERWGNQGLARRGAGRAARRRAHDDVELGAQERQRPCQTRSWPNITALCGGGAAVSPVSSSNAHKLPTAVASSI